MLPTIIDFFEPSNCTRIYIQHRCNSLKTYGCSLQRDMKFSSQWSVLAHGVLSCNNIDKVCFPTQKQLVKEHNPFVLC